MATLNQSPRLFSLKIHTEAELFQLGNETRRTELKNENWKNTKPLPKLDALAEKNVIMKKTAEYEYYVC